jgi:hypothetical protein
MKKLVLLIACLFIANCAHRRPENICAKYHERNSGEWFQCVQLEKIHRQQIADILKRD